MKNPLVLLAVMFAVSFASAQDVSVKEVPTLVITTLQNNYPNAKELQWEKEKGNYEAEFEVEKTEYSLLIDSLGNILETEVEIKVEALPVKVKDYISKNYAGQKIKEATKITDSKGIIYYEAEIEGKDLIFGSQENFIKEETDEESDNDKD